MNRVIKNSDGERILMFDGICMLCNSAVHFLHSRLKNSNYRFIPSQSEAGEEYIRKYKLDDLASSTLILIKNEQIFVKSKALFAILNDMHFLWKLLRIFSILPTIFLDWLYDRIANNRYKIFGKRTGDACYHEIETK